MVDSVLLVSNTSSTMQIISGLFVSQPISRIVPAQSCTEARRSLLESEFDLVIIDTPLPDEFGDDFALHAAESSGSGVVVLVDGIRLEDFGCIFVPLYDKIYEQAERSRMEYFVWDGTHPGIAGHMIIAREWLKAVEEND